MATASNQAPVVADPAPTAGAGAPDPAPTGGAEPTPQGAGAPDPAPTGSAADPTRPTAPEQMVPRSRINREVFAKHEALRRAEALEAENARLRAGAGGVAAQPPTDGAPPIDAATMDQLVQTRAAAIAREAEFDRRCNDVFQRGTKEIPDFAQALGAFNMFGGLGAHPEFVDAVTQLDDSPQVLHYLASHPDEAERVIGLHGAAQGVALGHLSAQLSAKPSAAAASRAPAPVAPVRGTAAPQAAPNDKGEFADQETFRRWRAEQRKR